MNSATSASLAWYKSVPRCRDWDEVFASSRRVSAPADWIFYLTDVVGSTKAIEAGRYKDVNIAGSLPVMALANLFGGLDFPFVFGGDGVTVFLPPEHDERVVAILKDTRKLSREIFDLDLRIARVPLASLAEEGATLELSTCVISDRYRQAVFFGDAVEAAEERLKDRNSQGGANPYFIDESPSLVEGADFTGFSCRWQDIPSPHGMTISLVVKQGQEGDAGWLPRVQEALAVHLGQEEKAHPLGIEEQRTAALAPATRIEARVEHWGKRKNAASGFLLRVRLALMIVAARVIIRFNIPFRQGMFQVNKQRESNRASSDVRKFDGCFKLIASATPDNVASLEKWLDAEEAAGRIVFGLHRTDRAHMTCMVHHQSVGEVHFVDAADGGYTMAAKKLKEKLRRPA